MVDEKKINEFMQFLTGAGIVSEINRVAQYYDDPKMFQYATDVFSNRNYSSAILHQKMASNGFSFVSPQTALLKCLVEAAERFCLASYYDKSIIRKSYMELPNALDPSFFSKTETIKTKKLGWVKGFNFTLGKPSFIPAQLVYLSYKRRKGELPLEFPSISTGGAGGFDPDMTLLNAVYEIVERDSFMNTYLNKISPPIIDINTLGRSTRQIAEYIGRYSLDLLILDITTDLKIPVFLSILFDKTEFGPWISMGAKAGFDPDEAITGSIAEAVMLRPWLRDVMRETAGQVSDTDDVILSRAKYWLNPVMKNNLEFFVLGPSAKLSRRHPTASKKQELERIKDILAKKKFNIYFADITHKVFKKTGFIAYKAVIPGLQPLYLNEADKKYINEGRLKDVSVFFGKKSISTNTVPHPFL